MHTEEDEKMWDEDPDELVNTCRNNLNDSRTILKL